jgi:RNA polymerase sigma factor (sigma-70 family)
MNELADYQNDMRDALKQEYQDKRSRLITSCLPLVMHIAHHDNTNIKFEDKIQYGNLALCRAADKFDKRKSQKKFAKYASKIIRNSLKETAWNIEHKGIRLPLVTIRQVDIIQKFRDEHGRLPTFDELRQIIVFKGRNNLTFKRYVELIAAYWSSRMVVVEPLADEINLPQDNAMIRKSKPSQQDK